ncbi:MAG: DUF2397 family protein [Proteobacteria bacterium]|nr:DUF2397 family protein [Pseudomonadota bacterium]
MTNPAHQEKSQLLGAEAQSAFEQGAGRHLITSRNRQLGSLLSSERGIYYTQILYRMLMFKREHELEPLYEDIFQAVRPAQNTIESGDYTSQQFRTDMAQLAEWDLVHFRIEKERLRGYRDNRKRKFRYTLTDECARFIEWLESRLADDLEERGHDTRDLLQEVCGSLNELLRLLHHLRRDDDSQGDSARRIIFQLFKIEDLTRAITAGLIEFNGRLLQFIIQSYNIAEIKAIISELDTYVQSFLSQVYALRREIIPLITRLQQEQNQNKLDLCTRIMEAERLRSPHLLQGMREAARVGIVAGLHSFYIENGKLDQLHQRIGASVLKVWQKLRSHLRELERKNNRLQDLQSRINEITTLPEDHAPQAFMANLLAPAHRYSDPHYWDEHEKASPPEPRRRVSMKEAVKHSYLPRKQQADRPVQSMDEARLTDMATWLAQAIMRGSSDQAKVSQGQFIDYSDLRKVMDLAQAGYLDNGRRLDRIDYQLTDDSDVIHLTAGEQALSLREIIVQQKSPALTGNKLWNPN